MRKADGVPAGHSDEWEEGSWRLWRDPLVPGTMYMLPHWSLTVAPTDRFRNRGSGYQRACPDHKAIAFVDFIYFNKQIFT